MPLPTPDQVKDTGVVASFIVVLSAVQVTVSADPDRRLLVSDGAQLMLTSRVELSAQPFSSCSPSMAVMVGMVAGLRVTPLRNAWLDSGKKFCVSLWVVCTSCPQFSSWWCSRFLRLILVLSRASRYGEVCTVDAPVPCGYAVNSVPEVDSRPALRRYGKEKCAQMVLRLPCLRWTFGHYFYEPFVFSGSAFAVWVLPEKSFFSPRALTAVSVRVLQVCRTRQELYSQVTRRTLAQLTLRGC